MLCQGASLARCPDRPTHTSHITGLPATCPQQVLFKLRCNHHPTAGFPLQRSGKMNGRRPDQPLKVAAMEIMASEGAVLTRALASCVTMNSLTAASAGIKELNKCKP